MNTTPVGVIVFDAKTGGVASVNREARRIVNGLCEPGGSAEQLLEVLTFRRADGREVSLQEFPLAQGLRTGETVRAEEIVLLAPDGRSVTILVNSTPIFSEEGEVESVVVTMQDMTPLEDLERLRAEFLGMVSHELRTPLTSIKGSADTLLEASAELDPAEMTQFFRIIRDQSESMRHLIGDLLDVAHIETGTLPVSPEPVAVTVLVDEARSRFQSGGGRNNLVIDLPPDLPRVMADRRRVVQVLNNLLSNAAPPLQRPVPHPGGRRVGEGPRRLLRRRRRRRGARRTAAPPVPQVLAAGGRGPGTGDRRVGPGPGPSARGSWRPTGDASGPRATGWAWAAGSPSPFRRWRRPLPSAPGGPGHGNERNRSRRASSAWTTTPRPSATCGTP